MTSELTSSEYFELIVNWFLNLLDGNVIEREANPANLHQNLATSLTFNDKKATEFKITNKLTSFHSFGCGAYFNKNKGLNV